jgi:hypothetical protein
MQACPAIRPAGPLIVVLLSSCSIKVSRVTVFTRDWAHSFGASLQWHTLESKILTEPIPQLIIRSTWRERGNGGYMKKDIFVIFIWLLSWQKHQLVVKPTSAGP